MPGYDADLLVVGAGPVGLGIACTLANRGLSVILMDARDPAAGLDAAFDGRASAIAAGSVPILEDAGVWSALAGDAEPIHEIRVSDGDSRMFLHFHRAELGRGPLGYMVENRFLRRALYRRAAALDGVVLLAPRRLAAMTSAGPRLRATLDDGTVVKARLAVAADGKHSATRARAGIAAHRRRYRQTAFVCTVAHEFPHGGAAQERFLPGGPFAVLPLTRDRSSLVWTEHARTGDAIAALDDDRFLDAVRRRIGDGLGTLSLAGPRSRYPVERVRARRLTAPRLALAGDAARAIHPIAGQGLNLGLRDVAALADTVLDTARLGLDIGGGDALRRYERRRRSDSLTMTFATDGLNRLFVAGLAPVRAARRLGLAAVNRTPALKRLFMRRAMGVAS